MSALWKSYSVHFDVRHHYTLQTDAKSNRAAVQKARELYDRQAGQNFVFELIDTVAENWEAEEIAQ